MDPEVLINYLKDELRQSGHPAVADVTDLDAPGVGVRCTDGVKVFTKVAWVGRADQRPGQPQWPSREDLTRTGARR
jgi:hypothetical protein